MTAETKHPQPPVSLHSRRFALANAKWRVCLDHLRDNRGHEVRDYIVLVPAITPRPDSVTGVTVLPVLNGEIVLLRNYRHSLARYHWEAVRGFVDAGEEPSRAAARELSEETGLLCDLVDLLPLGYCAPEASTIAGRAMLFAATRCRPGPPADHAELGLGDPVAMHPNEILGMLERFEIEDATTEIALRRYLALSR